MSEIDLNNINYKVENVLHHLQPTTCNTNDSSMCYLKLGNSGFYVVSKALSEPHEIDSKQESLARQLCNEISSVFEENFPKKVETFRKIVDFYIDTPNENLVYEDKNMKRIVDAYSFSVFLTLTFFRNELKTDIVDIENLRASFLITEHYLYYSSLKDSLEIEERKALIRNDSVFGDYLCLQKFNKLKNEQPNIQTLIQWLDISLLSGVFIFLVCEFLLASLLSFNINYGITYPIFVTDRFGYACFTTLGQLLPLITAISFVLVAAIVGIVNFIVDKRLHGMTEQQLLKATSQSFEESYGIGVTCTLG
ncbi:MAG: hypothetical protein LBJ93_01780 [Clostridiales bacterium]|jgi:hypothetical protein|nr:hypothetical protein [Clostridiales bacterium]